MKHPDTQSLAVPAEVMRRSVERTVFFSDAVFAIAITLLALEIRLPEGIDLESPASVQAALSATSSQFLAFGLSFLIIGLFWMSHLRKYRALARHDGWFTLLNLVLLMFIGLMPFATNLMSSSNVPIAMQLYAGLLTCIGVVSAHTWRYALEHHFIDPLPSERLQRSEFLQPLVMAATFGASIIIANYDVNLARWFWFVQTPLWIIVSRFGSPRAK